MSRVVLTASASCSPSRDQRGARTGYVFWTCRLLHKNKGGKLSDHTVDVELPEGQTPKDSDVQAAIVQTKTAE